MNLRDECNQVESSIAYIGALTWNVLSPYVLGLALVLVYRRQNFRFEYRD